MAKLRKVGNAFAGIGESLNRLIPILLQDKLGRERDTLNDTRLRERAVEDDARGTTQRRETALLGMLPKLMAGEVGPEMFGSDLQSALPLDAMRPSPDKLLSGLMDEISGAENLSKLGSADVTRARAGQRLSRAGYDPLGDQGSLSQFKTIQSPSVDGSLASSSFVPAPRPEIESLMAARNAQRGSIINEIERAQDQKFADAQGVAYNTGKGKEQIEAESFGAVQDRALQTGRQENQLKVEGETALNPVRAAGAAQTARATLPIDLEKARETARINQIYGEWSPEIMSRRLDFEKSKALQTQQVQRSADVMQMADAVGAIQQPMQELVDLSAKVNTSDKPQPLSWLAGQTQLGTGEHLLNTKSRALAMQVVNAMGWNKGATSENDVNAIVALLPTAYDSKEQAAIKIADFNKRIYGGYASLANAPAGMDPLSRINVTRAALNLPAWRQQDFAAGMAPPVTVSDPAAAARAALEAARGGR